MQKSKNREPFAKTQKNKGFFRKPKKADNDNVNDNDNDNDNVNVNDNVNDNEDVYDNVDENDTDTVNENDAAKAARKDHKGVKNKKAGWKYKACRGGSLCFQKNSYMGFLFYGNPFFIFESFCNFEQKARICAGKSVFTVFEAFKNFYTNVAKTCI